MESIICMVINSNDSQGVVHKNAIHSIISVIFSLKLLSDPQFRSHISLIAYIFVLSVPGEYFLMNLDLILYIHYDQFLTSYTVFTVVSYHKMILRS